MHLSCFTFTHSVIWRVSHQLHASENVLWIVNIVMLYFFLQALSSVCDDRAHDVTLPILYRSKSADALIPRRKSMAILSWRIFPNREG